MDPIRYPNPFAFDPERFLVKDTPMRWGGGPDSDRDQLSCFSPHSDLHSKHCRSRLVTFSAGVDDSVKGVTSRKLHCSSSYPGFSGESISRLLSIPILETPSSPISMTRSALLRIVLSAFRKSSRRLSGRDRRSMPVSSNGPLKRLRVNGKHWVSRLTSGSDLSRPTLSLPLGI